MDDGQLKKGILEGDEECLNMLVNDFAPRLVAYIEKRDVAHQDALEVVNDTLYKIVKKIEFFDPKKGKFTSWIYAIAIHTLSDSLKKAEKHNTVQSLEERAEKGFQDSIALWQTHEASGGYQLQLSKTLLEGSLKCISERDRIILTEWSYGLKHKEIGKILGISENAAKVAYHRALKKLKIAANHIIESMNNEKDENLKSLFKQEGRYE